MSNSLIGQVGEVAMTVSIKRKETGVVETYQLVGKVTGDDLEKLNEGVAKNGSDPHNSGS